MSGAGFFKFIVVQGAIGVCLVTWTKFAWCETSELVTDAPANRRIQINLVADVGSVPDLNSLLLEWFGSEGSTLQFRKVPALRPDDVLTKSAEPQLLNIWLVLHTPDLVRVYFAEGTGQRFLVRDIPLRSGLDEFGRENVAQVVVTSAAAFSQHTASSTVKQVVETFQRPPEPDKSQAASKDETLPAPVPSARPSVWFFRVGALYGLSLEQSAAISHGPGLLVGAGQNCHGARWLYSLKVQYHLPWSVDGAEVALAFHALTVRTTAAVESPIGHHLMGGLELGADLDRVSFDSTALAGTSVATRGGGVQYRPLVVSGLRASLEAGASRFTLALGVTAALVKTHYDVVRDTQSQTEYRPWLVRPYLAFEASWR
jgi:hypothetical protein